MTFLPHNVFYPVKKSEFIPTCIIVSIVIWDIFYFEGFLHRVKTLNPLPQMSEFQLPWKRLLLKTVWEKEKMLATIIFSFIHNVFILLKTNTIILGTYQLLYATFFFFFSI